MAEWIDFEDIMEDQMKQPGFKERFDQSYSEFTKKMDAELAAERVQQTVPTPARHAPHRASYAGGAAA